MSRVRSVLLFATILFVASCDDEPETKPLAPTAPVAVPEVAPAILLSEAPVKVKGSSVCSAFLRERTKLLDQLTKTPDDAALLKRAKSLAAVITDACN
jgi:hypothetical protein